MEWTIEEAHNNPALRDCLEAWLATKGLPPLHFVIEPETLERLKSPRLCRSAWFKGRCVSILSPVPTRDGWLTEQFPHRPEAPNGTVELMMDQAIRKLGDEGYEYVTSAFRRFHTAQNWTATKTPRGSNSRSHGCENTASGSIISMASTISSQS